MVYLLVMAIGTASLFTASKFFEDAATEYSVAKAQADGFRAHMLAKAGFMGAIGDFKKNPRRSIVPVRTCHGPTTHSPRWRCDLLHDES